MRFMKSNSLCIARLTENQPKVCSLLLNHQVQRLPNQCPLIEIHAGTICHTVSTGSPTTSVSHRLRKSNSRSETNILLSLTSSEKMSDAVFGVATTRGFHRTCLTQPHASLCTEWTRRTSAPHSWYHSPMTFSSWSRSAAERNGNSKPADRAALTIFTLRRTAPESVRTTGRWSDTRKAVISPVCDEALLPQFEQGPRHDHACPSSSAMPEPFSA